MKKRNRSDIVIMDGAGLVVVEQNDAMTSRLAAAPAADADASVFFV